MITTITQFAPLEPIAQLIIGAIVCLIFAACMRGSSNRAIGVALIGAVGPMLVNSYVYMAVAVVVVFFLATKVPSPQAKHAHVS